MTDTATFARLEDVNLREAWVHEAQHFTPWLAANLDRLAEAIGIPLEHTGSEVAVEAFSADIVARNPQDETVVLIENQLEASDHVHLGQIMTYLAGLSAQTIIWVAPSFREPHLSAIRWLNEHTSEEFAFFAIKVRVVRIAGSPFAPLFDVLERPNGWDRQLQGAVRESRNLTELGRFRLAFWSHLVNRCASLTLTGPAGPNSNRPRPVRGTDCVIVQYPAQQSVGIFIRGTRGQSKEETEAMLRPFELTLAERLGAPLGGAQGMFFSKPLRIDSRNAANWDQMADWLAGGSDQYAEVLEEVFGAGVA